MPPAAAPRTDLPSMATAGSPATSPSPALARRAATHRDALVLGQVEVGAKSNEIPMFAPLLDRLADAGVDLSRAVITADALCRYRHKASYVDLRIMPMSGPKALVVAVSVVVRSA